MVNIEELALIESNKPIWEVDLVEYVEGDPDSSVLVLDLCYRYLEAKGCNNIILLTNCGVNKKLNRCKDRTKIKNTMYLCGDNNMVTLDDGVEINVLEKLKNIEITLRYKGSKPNRNRSGFLFTYKDKWRALEVDTLLGPRMGYNCNGNKEEHGWVFHSLGNMGLIPYGAGSPGGNRKTKESLQDIINVKVIKRFNEYKSGFLSSDEINDLMNYSEMAKISKANTIEQVKEVIINRGREVYGIIDKYNMDSKERTASSNRRDKGGL